MNERILFVDDEQRVLDALRRMLRSQRAIWDIVCVSDPNTAWQLLQDREFDAVVSDIHMPALSGLELLERMRGCPRLQTVPVIMLTGLESRSLKRDALDLGAADLLNKPVDPEDLVARLRSVLRLKKSQDELAAANRMLESKVRERTAELHQSRSEVIWRLAKAAEHRDEHSGNHVIRVACFSRMIAEEIGMPRDFVETLFAAAPLHDIGKIGIPDSILTKSEKLTEAEWNVMKTHCQIGAKILEEETLAEEVFERWQGHTDLDFRQAHRNPILRMATTIALRHHEKWDGTGYPGQLIGEAIPIEARIVAVSDVFDALTSRRPYKEAYSAEEALEIMASTTDCHFDPDVYGAFVRVLPEIFRVREEIPDLPTTSTFCDEKRHDANLICG
jgi:putative two-component system response regulator